MTARTGALPDRDPEAGLFTRPFLALSAATLAFFISGAVFLPVVPRFTIGPLRGDEVAVGLVLGAFSVASLLMRPFAGRLADTRGRRMVLIAGAVITVGASFGHLLADSIPLLMAMRVVFGVGVAFTFPAIMAMAVIGVRADERGAVVGTAGLFVDAAFGLSPAVLGLLARSAGYPSTFLVSAVVAAFGAAWLLLRRPGRAAMSAA